MRNRHLPRILGATLLTGPLLGLLPGCAATATALASVAVSQEFIDNANSAYMNVSADDAWVEVKHLLTSLSLGHATYDEELMTAKATFDGATVTAVVELFDVDRCKLSVGAKRWGVYQAEMAEDILNQLRKELAG